MLKPLHVVRGSTHTVGPLEVRDHVGQIVDLAGAVVHSTIRLAPFAATAVVAKVSSSVGSGITIAASSGQITVAFQPSETRSLTPGEYVWDAWAVLPDGRRLVVVHPSRFQLVREVTAIPA